MDSASKAIRDHAQRLITEADSLKAKGIKHPGTPRAFVRPWIELPRSDAQRIDTRARALLSQPNIPPTYLSQYTRRCEHPFQGADLDGGMDSLRALVADIDDGVFPSVGSVVHAHTLTDVLDQADASVAEQKFLQAVMLAGAVLEAHLRYIGEGRALSLPRSSIGGWNEQLFKAGAYDKPTHGLIATWANLRNDADHLKVQSFTEVTARSMTVGVRDLLARLPS